MTPVRCTHGPFSHTFIILYYLFTSLLRKPQRAFFHRGQLMVLLMSLLHRCYPFRRGRIIDQWCVASVSSTPLRYRKEIALLPQLLLLLSVHHPDLPLRLPPPPPLSLPPPPPPPPPLLSLPPRPHHRPMVRRVGFVYTTSLSKRDSIAATASSSVVSSSS